MSLPAAKIERSMTLRDELHNLRHPYSPNTLAPKLFEASELDMNGILASSSATRNHAVFVTQYGHGGRIFAEVGSDLLHVSFSLFPGSGSHANDFSSFAIYDAVMNRDGVMQKVNNQLNSFGMRTFYRISGTTEGKQAVTYCPESAASLVIMINKLTASQIKKITEQFGGILPDKLFCIDFALVEGSSTIMRPSRIFMFYQDDKRRETQIDGLEITDPKIIAELVGMGVMPARVDGKATAERILYASLSQQDIDQRRMLVPEE